MISRAREASAGIADVISRSVMWPVAASRSRDVPEIDTRDVTDPDAVAVIRPGSGYYSRA